MGAPVAEEAAPCAHTAVDDDGYCEDCGFDTVEEDDGIEDAGDDETRRYAFTMNNPHRPVPARYSKRICPVDSVEFTPTRSDQETCSGKCKARKYRINKLARAGGKVPVEALGMLQVARDKQLAAMEAEAVKVDRKAAVEREYARAAEERAAAHDAEAASMRAKAAAFAATPLIATKAAPKIEQNPTKTADVKEPSPPDVPVKVVLVERWWCTKVCGEGPWDDRTEPDACPCGGNLAFSATAPLGPAAWRGGDRTHRLPGKGQR